MNKISILFAVLAVAWFAGCNDDTVSSGDTKNNRQTLVVTAAMPAGETETRVALEEMADSKNLNATWQHDDKIAFFFVQNNQSVAGGEASVANLSAGGKQCGFTLPLPAGIDSEQPFDLYAFCGTDAKIKNGNICADLTPQTTRVLNDIQAPVWAKLTDARGGETLALQFQYLGVVELVHLQNNATEEIRFTHCGLALKETGDLWYYLPKRRPDKTYDAYYFNAQTQTVEEHNDPSQHLGTPPETAVPAGQTATVAAWYYPKPNGVPKTKLTMVFAPSGEVVASEESNPARNQPLQAGKAYHIRGAWNGQKLTLNGTSLPPETDLPSITLTTAKAVGNTIDLTIDAGHTDKKDVWIDLNNNGRKEVGEKVIFNSHFTYTIASSTVTLYGKVIELSCFGNELISLDVSKNTVLKELGCYKNQLSSLDISKNTNLRWLSCGNNELTSLDVSKNTKLEQLFCAENQITSLDISKNRALIQLDCSENKLIYLDVANGKNTKFLDFYAQNNPNLKIIYIDKGFTPDWTWKDETAQWVEKE